MGGISNLVRATWRIANLTPRDLYGHDPTLQDTHERGKVPGKETKGWRGEVKEGQSPSLEPRSGSSCGAKRSSPFTCREADK
jgi:hypothetical protein